MAGPLNSSAERLPPWAGLDEQPDTLGRRGWGRRGWLAAVLLLLVVVVAQELRWQLRDPFELSGLSHAVGVPEGRTLTAGYAVRNRSRLPVRVVGVDIVGDRERGPSGEVSDTVRLDILEVLELRGVDDGHAVAALPQGPRERRLTGGPPAGSVVEPGQSMELAAVMVGSGPAEFELGPIEVRWRLGPLTGVSEVPLPRGYRVRVTPDRP